MSSLKDIEFLPHQLRRCNNRASIAKNSKSGEPTQWLAESKRFQKNFRGLNFDFFIDWKNNTFSKEIWIKLLIERDSMRLLLSSSAQEIIDWMRGIQSIRDICNFASKNELSAKFLLIDPEFQYEEDMDLLSFHFCALCHIRVEKLQLRQLKNRIQQLSGGPVRIGNKGLYYAESMLECILSKTTSLWPGDADLLLISKNQYAPSLLIELKKHNKDTPLVDQKLSNYYPKPDARKYNRLGILANYFSIPFLNIYWSTNPNEKKVKLELLRYSDDEVSALKDKVLNIPRSESEYDEFYSEVMTFCAIGQ